MLGVDVSLAIAVLELKSSGSYQDTFHRLGLVQAQLKKALACSWLNIMGSFHLYDHLATKSASTHEL